MARNQSHGNALRAFDIVFNRDQKPPSSPYDVPPAAKWLGALGVIPFLCLGLASLFLVEGQKLQAIFALVAYGAVILSFLGAIHWGLAVAGFEMKERENLLLRRLSLSVLPSLIGWWVLLMPARQALLILAAAFFLLMLLDLVAGQKKRCQPGILSSAGH